MKALVRVASAAMLLSLCGCLSSNVQMYNAIDTMDKSITVPAGNALLVGAIKQRLRANGWKLMVDVGPMRTVGTVSPTVNLATADTFHTRYRLVIRQYQVDACFPMGDPLINYDLSLIDNHTGEEVLTESGHDCRDSAADKFLAALNGAR